MAGYANILCAPCILIQTIFTCFAWNKRNKRLEAEGKLGGSVDPAKTKDEEYKKWHDEHFGTKTARENKS